MAYWARGGTWEGQMTCDLNVAGCVNYFDICNDVFFLWNMLLSLLLLSFHLLKLKNFKLFFLNNLNLLGSFHYIGLTALSFKFSFLT